MDLQMVDYPMFFFFFFVFSFRFGSHHGPRCFPFPFELKPVLLYLYNKSAPCYGVVRVPAGTQSTVSRARPASRARHAITVYPRVGRRWRR